MQTISLAELKQNPHAAIDGIERGDSYVITRYRKPVGLLTPLPRTRTPVTGAEATAALRLTPVDPDWPGELETIRESVRGRDWWAET
jgi:antitoxin (DNA-binding transcriptional repressor) of toxin-antitoxin stability system